MSNEWDHVAPVSSHYDLPYLMDQIVRAGKAEVDGRVKRVINGEERWIVMPTKLRNVRPTCEAARKILKLNFKAQNIRDGVWADPPDVVRCWDLPSMLPHQTAYQGVTANQMRRKTDVVVVEKTRGLLVPYIRINRVIQV